MGNACITSKKGATTGHPSSGGSFTASGSRSTSGQFDEREYPDGRILEVRTYSLLELKKATYNFRPGGVLGAGGFGTVYKGWIDQPTRNGNRLVVAVKKLNSRSTQGLEEWQSEINFVGRLSHPNLVKLLGHCSEDNEYLLVYEFMAKGSLESHIFRRGCVPLSWEQRLKIVTGAARGLAYLHEKGLIYRDFKASNILLDENCNAKVSDFGLVKLGPTGNKSHISTRVMGTYGYAAPEYLATGHLYVKSDVYGFGVVLLEMLSGKRALDLKHPDEGSLADWVRPYLISHRKLAPLMDLRFEGQYSSKQAFQAVQLTLNCVADEPRNRPSMKEVVETLEKIESMKSQAHEARGSSSRSSQDQHHDRTGAAHRRLPRAGDPRGRSRARAHLT